MATREQKKVKLKTVRQKQKINREKNKDLAKKDIKMLDFNMITRNDGIKAYVLLELGEIIESLRENDNDDIKIINTAKILYYFAINPIKIYNKYLSENRSNMSKETWHRVKALLKNDKYILNTTERAVLKSETEAIIMEYTTKNLEFEGIDYGAIKVCFELAYKTIFTGLKEKKISRIEMYVGYEDNLSDFEVSYIQENEKYNLDGQILILTIWNALDELYNQHEIYKHKYINFNEDSLRTLATAIANEKEYEIRKYGKELVSYSGIILNYVGVLEVELKRLISEKFNIDSKKLRLVDAIEYLKKYNFGELSEKEIVEKLHEIRRLRNQVAHGYAVSYDECEMIKNFLINGQVLEFISWNLNKSNKEKEF